MLMICLFAFSEMKQIFVSTSYGKTLRAWERHHYDLSIKNSALWEDG